MTKRVSFKVAKALKEAGYPQGETDNTILPKYYGLNGKFVKLPLSGEQVVYFAPFYNVIWFWLWRKKGIQIDIDYASMTCSIYRYALCCKTFELADPEEAIIKAIEYLVENDLIK